LIIGLAKAERDRRQRADHVILADCEAPSVAACNADRLTDDPVLAHRLARDPHALRHWFIMAEHPNRKRKRVWPHVTADRIIERLKLRRHLLVYRLISLHSRHNYRIPNRVQSREWSRIVNA